MRIVLKIILFPKLALVRKRYNEISILCLCNYNTTGKVLRQVVHFLENTFSSYYQMENCRSCEDLPELEYTNVNFTTMNNATESLSLLINVESGGIMQGTDDVCGISHGLYTMNTADWRWAADKGFWDPIRRCWNEELGGKKAYMEQRNQRRAARAARQRRITDKEVNNSTAVDRKLRIKKRPKPLYTTEILKARTLSDVVPRSTASQGCPVPFAACSIPNKFNCDGLDEAELQKRPAAITRVMQKVVAHWPELICRRYWTSGHQEETLLAIFDELPSELRSAIGDAIRAAQRFADAEQQFIRAAAAYGDSKSILESAAAVAAQWEGDTEHGFVCVDLEPDTQERRAVAANPRGAELLGLRPAELAERFALRGVPLPLLPLDAVRCFLGSLRRARDEAATSCCRILIDGGRRAALASVSSAKSFNARGQLCQVRTQRASVHAAPPMTAARTRPHR